jgi:hypothetical protein
VLPSLNQAHRRTLAPIATPTRLLLGPGPSNAHPTVRGIALLADVVCEQLLETGLGDRDSVGAVVRVPFDHLCRGLAASNVRAR